MNGKKILLLTQGAIIASLYVVLTLLANALGLAGNAIQVRFSESLTILPLFTPAAVPGLFVGCLLANLLTGAHIIDVVFGSLATLLAAYLSYIIGKRVKKSLAANAKTKGRAFAQKLAVCIPPILCNGLIVPFILKYAYGITPVWMSMVTVSVGQIISAGLLGAAVLSAIERGGLHKLLSSK